MEISLCHIDDIPEDGALGIDLPQAKVFAVKKRGEVYLYRNRCPHLGIPLNFQPNRFLDPDGAYIICSGHGALFVIESGDCILGPCQGQGLWQLEYSLENGLLSISEEELPALNSPR